MSDFIAKNASLLFSAFALLAATGCSSSDTAAAGGAGGSGAGRGVGSGAGGGGGAGGGSNQGSGPIWVFPTAAVAPKGSYQSVTAIVNGASDKTVTWSTDGGTIVGTNPCTANEPCTIALHATKPGTYHLKASSNADPSFTASAAITITGSPTPRQDHPRLIVTSDMLPSLRAKAVDDNPIYAALKTTATNQATADDAIWSWTCNGGAGAPSSDQSQSYQEVVAYNFAMMALIAPTKAERDQWGCYGHDVFMTMVGYVLDDALDLSQGNHWSDSARQITLTADMLMGAGYLTSAADLNLVRQYLAKIAYLQINDIYNGTLATIGGYNGPAQLAESSEWSLGGMRAMGNNYTQSRILYLTAAALTFNDDPTDDPPLSNTCNAKRYEVCPDGTAGSLHAYWSYVAGGMLYKDWADLEDPAVAQAAYHEAFSNLPKQPMCNTAWHDPIPCFGQGRGGESNEGTSYGASLTRLRYAMNAIHTAGYDDPILYGPQISIGTMSYWDLRYVSDLTLLPGRSGGSADRSQFTAFTNGDTLYNFVYPTNYGAEAATLTADTYVGRTDRAAAIQWLVMNTAFGGADGKGGGCVYYCGFDSELVNDFGSDVAWDFFISMPAKDPVAANPPDPRPDLPRAWYEAANQHIVSRSGWDEENTILSYYCTNTQIDHEHEYCGGFDVYSQGEFVTKTRTEFNDYINTYSAALNKNIPAYLNTPSDTYCTYDNGCYWADMTQLGGQFWHGLQAGNVKLLHDDLAGYVSAIADTTNAYNGGWGNFGNLDGITHASRSLVYVRGSNQVVYYDRGDSGTNAWDKANYVVTTGAPTVTGSVATWPTRSGKQTVFWTALLPASASPSLDATYAGDSHATDDWEIYGRLKVDAGAAASARFLSVLEWVPSSGAQSSTTAISSSAGTEFDGALVGKTAVLFKRKWSDKVSTFSYSAPGATSHYVADLVPDHHYKVSAAGSTPIVTDRAGVLTFTASADTITVTDAGN